MASRPRKELVYNGKPLRSYCWQLYAGTTQDRNEATEALNSLGQRAVPDLIRLVQAREPFLRSKLWAIAMKLPPGVRFRLLRGVRPLDTIALQQGAARALGVIGPEAREAIPALT